MGCRTCPILGAGLVAPEGYQPSRSSPAKKENPSVRESGTSKERETEHKLDTVCWTCSQATHLTQAAEPGPSAS